MKQEQPNLGWVRAITYSSWSQKVSITMSQGWGAFCVLKLNPHFDVAVETFTSAGAEMP